MVPGLPRSAFVGDDGVERCRVPEIAVVENHRHRFEIAAARRRRELARQVAQACCASRRKGRIGPRGRRRCQSRNHKARTNARERAASIGDELHGRLLVRLRLPETSANGRGGWACAARSYLGAPASPCPCSRTGLNVAFVTQFRCRMKGIASAGASAVRRADSGRPRLFGRDQRSNLSAQLYPCAGIRRSARMVVCAHRSSITT